MTPQKSSMEHSANVALSSSCSSSDDDDDTDPATWLTSLNDDHEHENEHEDAHEHEHEHEHENENDPNNVPKSMTTAPMMNKGSTTTTTPTATTRTASTNTNYGRSHSTSPYRMSSSYSQDSEDSNASASASSRGLLYSLSEIPYESMMEMTMELLSDLCYSLRPGDSVLTLYGMGTVLPNTCVTKTLKIQLWNGPGMLYSPAEQWDSLHKLLTEEQYSQAMDHLEQVRKLQLAKQCHEWNIDYQKHAHSFVHATCVPCLFEKPTTTSWITNANTNCSKENDYQDTDKISKGSSNTTNNTTTTTPTPRKARFWHRSNSAPVHNKTTTSTTTTDKNKKSNKKKKTREPLQTCDVCGNPVCCHHKVPKQFGGGENFCMCMDCWEDVWIHTQPQYFNVHHPMLKDTLNRLVLLYWRMQLKVLQRLPELPQLCEYLTSHQKTHGKIKLGNSALGFVGAALSVAGAAAIMTPAAPAIFLAAACTSATSGTFQFTHQTYTKYFASPQKAANVLADQCLGWYGLLLCILQSIERLRQDLVTENNNTTTSSTLKKSKNPKLHQLSSSHTNNNNHSKGLEIWNTLAVGSFTTTRSAMTGVGVTSAMGATYSQAINTSLQGIPVVGAAFSVGCMAMDAASIKTAVKEVSSPSQKALALQQLFQWYCHFIPNSIRHSIQCIHEAVQDLQERLELQRQEQETLQIELELQGL